MLFNLPIYHGAEEIKMLPQHCGFHYQTEVYRSMKS